MGFVATWIVFDPADGPTPLLDTRELKDLGEVQTLLDRLSAQKPGPNPRLERLLGLLAQHHPGKVWASSTSLGQAIELTPLPPGLKGEGRDAALWTLSVELDDPGELEVVVPDMLFWARELGLDVYDEMQGVFLAWRGKPVPWETGAEYAVQSGWGRPLKAWPSALDLRQGLIAGLTQALCFNGFAFAPEPGWDAVFVRKIEDGYQKVSARLKGQAPGWLCDFAIEQGSQTLTKAVAAAGYPLGNPNRLNKAFLLDLSDFRSLHNPGWDRLGAKQDKLAWTEGWVDWMLDDLKALVLPVLDKAQTLEGLDALYHRPEVGKLFPLAVRPLGEIDNDVMEPVLAIAYAAHNPEFEALAKRIEDQLTRNSEVAYLKVINSLLAVLRGERSSGVAVKV
jgi:hypothetical protein